MAAGASNPDPERPQNIYDQPEFLAGYSRMERFEPDWGVALEHPRFEELLPDVHGVRVLDLGCGAGHLSLHLAQSGASDVLGVDVSESMLEVARLRRSHPRITYRRCAIEDLQFEAARFDLVVSSLAFHYVADYARVVQNVAEWLAPGGMLAFSTEHPIYTARLPGDGWILDERGERQGWRIDDYFVEGPREETWFVAGVRKYHRTLATLIDTLLLAGLKLERVIEPAPTADRLRERPHEAEHLRRPMFLLLSATKPK
jgi:SAM-dependent methyltransferase